MTPRSFQRRAFTLVELLVVIAVIGILVGMLMPAVQQVREAARRTNCLNNIRQLAMASQSYEGAHQRLPDGHWQADHVDLAAISTTDDIDSEDSSIGAYGGYSLRYFGYTLFPKLLPWVEQSATYEQWRFEPHADFAKLNGCIPGTDDQEGETSPSATPVPVFICPSDGFERNVVELDKPGMEGGGGTSHARGFFGVNSYAGNMGTLSGYFLDWDLNDDGVFYITGPDSKFSSSQSNLDYNQVTCKLSSVLDGQSNTIMFGEKYHIDNNFDDLVYGSKSWYPIGKMGVWGWYGGVNTGMAMSLGSTVGGNGINYRTPSPDVYNALSTGEQWDVYNWRTSGFGSGHPGGANFAMADGSGRFISETINLDTYVAIGTRKGREVVTVEY